MSLRGQRLAFAIGVLLASVLLGVTVSRQASGQSAGGHQSNFPVTSGNSGRALCQPVAWTQGTGAGQISLGTSLPNGTFVSATGCDEGGLITFTTGLNTITGSLFVIHFSQNFAQAPSVVFYPGDGTTATLFFTFQMFGSSTTSSATLNIQSPPGNSTFKIYWQVKGST